MEQGHVSQENSFSVVKKTLENSLMAHVKLYRRLFSSDSLKRASPQHAERKEEDRKSISSEPVSSFFF